MIPGGTPPLEAIRRCAADPAFIAVMERFYGDLDRRIGDQRPECTNRGACCKFATYDHNLFVTSPELAWFVARSGGPILAPPDRSHCPYQQGGSCTAREARPAGCRVFFCDPAAQSWQSPMTEDALRRLAEISDEFELPYAYLEWTDALRAMGAVTPAPEGPERKVVQIDTRFDAP